MNAKLVKGLAILGIKLLFADSFLKLLLLKPWINIRLVADLPLHPPPVVLVAPVVVFFAPAVLVAPVVVFFALAQVVSLYSYELFLQDVATYNNHNV